MAPQPDPPHGHDASSVNEKPSANGKHASDHGMRSVAELESGVERLSTELLIHRTSDLFPIGYLTLIAIIQGGAFIVALQTAVTVLSSPHLTLPMRTALVGRAVIGVASIIIVSYEYLWFTTVMRWTPSFLDTLVPYVLGIGEVISGQLLLHTFQWWIATCTFLIVAAGAFLHTVARSTRAVFREQPGVYGILQRLLKNLAACCLIAASWGVVVLIAGKSSGYQGWLNTFAPWIMLPMGIVMVTLTERDLTKSYERYGIPRSWRRAREQESRTMHKH
jgi:hypothetical protein